MHRQASPGAGIRTDLFTPSAAHSSSPYRGIADYRSVRIGDNEHRDVAWGIALRSRKVRRSPG
ncbi:hypothetical protein NBRGN_027_02120 [Nocardia brasiliensis NBRC 14402]|uniref:DUF427 domain-containing protein n=1 Tax=Nocardia brasiliensis TaxID=37326 RepID=UPI00045CA744|nr:DUF427 domain-containing protein [Nocardia brasiliensis]GAJ80555.1 hypothetical protein NBRGN_027_02120 [Nocardia brasiliensis NBRC 14402]